VHHVLFGSRFDWQDRIRAQVDPARYSVAFHDFDGVGLDDYDCVIPLHFRDYAALRRRPAAHRRYLLPSADTVSLCNNKLRLNRFLIEAGFQDVVPTLYANAAEACPPYVLKKEEDEAGCHTFVVHDPVDDAAYAARMRDERFFRQQAIPGDTEWAAHFLAVDGDILFTTHVRYRTTAPLSVHGVRSPPADMASLPDLRLHERLAQIIRLLRYTGTGCADYKIVDGAPKLFEINPRLGWSLNADINRYLDCHMRAIGRRVAG
jgi:hypothetical protein